MIFNITVFNILNGTIVKSNFGNFGNLEIGLKCVNCLEVIV